MTPPKQPDIDPAVGWAIEQAVNAAETRFTATLDKKLDAMRDEYRTCATCIATHRDVDNRITAATNDADEAKKAAGKAEARMWWAVGIALVSALGMLGTIIGAVVTGHLTF